MCRGDAADSWFWAFTFAPAAIRASNALALPHIAAICKAVWPSELPYEGSSPSAKHALMALASSLWAAANNLVDGSNDGGGGRVWNGGGANDRAASSSNCSSNSMAIVQTPATSRASRFTTFSVMARAIASRAGPPAESIAAAAGSVQGMSA